MSAALVRRGVIGALAVSNRSLRFYGLFAWLLWRAIYLVKLSGFEQQVGVLSDWIIELFFPRDIVQAIDFSIQDGTWGIGIPMPSSATAPAAH